MITRHQIKAARTILGWGVRDLAQKTDLAQGTISRIEGGKEAMSSSLRRIRHVLEQAGIDFPDAYTLSYRRMVDRDDE